MWQYQRTEDLYHHGIQGQKWGIRRFQNQDGSLTPAGYERYKQVKKTSSTVINVIGAIQGTNIALGSAAVAAMLGPQAALGPLLLGEASVVGMAALGKTVVNRIARGSIKRNEQHYKKMIEDSKKKK